MSKLGAQPRMYEDVLIIGGGSPKSDGLPCAKLGGLWVQPNYALSYLLAARCVIEKGDEAGIQNEIALPAAYLQRHAFELALKQLIESAFMIKADTDWLERVKLDAQADRPKQLNVKFTHPLGKVVGQLRRALEQIDLGAVPGDIEDMAKRLVGVEALEPTRLRYPKIQGREGECTSFPNPTLIRVGETQKRLEALFERRFVHREGADPDGNLAVVLAYEGMALDQAIRQHVPIDDL